MDGLDIFAFVVMFTIAASIGVAIFVLGKLPGDIAKKRSHPQTSAITVCGWLGILTFGLLWSVALIWAYSSTQESQEKTIEQLHAQITELEQKLASSQHIQKGAIS